MRKYKIKKFTVALSMLLLLTFVMAGSFYGNSNKKNAEKITPSNMSNSKLMTHNGQNTKVLILAYESTNHKYTPSERMSSYASEQPRLSNRASSTESVYALDFFGASNIKATSGDDPNDGGTGIGEEPIGEGGVYLIIFSLMYIYWIIHRKKAVANHQNECT